jgi:hypothetical protein
MMYRIPFLAVSAVALIVTGCSQSAPQPASPGPNGGDLVPIRNGTAYAEFVANADTG